MPTSIAYRNNWILPFRFDSGNTMYLDKANPMGKVMLKDIMNAKMCGAMTIPAVCTGCSSNI